jgi:hypothetical protein
VRSERSGDVKAASMANILICHDDADDGRDQRAGKRRLPDIIYRTM